jgi:predicted nucleic acid-binding protein
MLLLDTSGLLAALDAGQAKHAECAAVIAGRSGPFLLSPFVLAELDYLLGSRVGATAQDALLAEVARGAYRLEPFDATDVDAARKVVAKYRDHRIGLADASIVVLAARHRVRDLLTLDHRHFSVIRPGPGRTFRLWP